MLPIKNIRHPTDFSELSAQALRLATRIARDYHATLNIVHVVHEPVALYTEGGIIPTSLDERRDQIQERLVRMHPADPTIAVSHFIEEGHPGTEILRLAERIRANLIVMGTHGRHGFQRL